MVERGGVSLTEQEYITAAQALREKLYRTAFLYLGSEALALDAVDEAFYRGFRTYRKLRQREFFNTWMTRILINVCNTELRRRRRETAVDVLPEQAVEDFDALPLKEALARLSEELRAVVALRYFAGLTLAETAETLGIPPGTAATRQRRALELLRLELTEEV